MRNKTMIFLDKSFSLLLRITVCPFVFCTVFIRMLYNPFYFTAMFLLYGGEHISYVAKDKKQIYDLYKKLEEQTKENHDHTNNRT